MYIAGENINEVEKIAAEKTEEKYAAGLSAFTAVLHLCCKLDGERWYGRNAISHGALECKRVITVNRDNREKTLILCGFRGHRLSSNYEIFYGLHIRFENRRG